MCYNAVSAGKGVGGGGVKCQCNVSKTYYSKIWLNSEP